MAEVGAGANEVSLVDLWRILVRQKRMLFMVWAITMALAVLYILVATPVYKSEVFMLPPSQKDIQPLNITISDRSGCSDRSDRSDGYDTGQVYQLFIQSLKSRAMRRAFYEKHGIAKKLGLGVEGDPDVFFETQFNKRLQVSQNVKKKEEAGFASLSFEGKDPELITQWVNDFVQETSEKVASVLAGEVAAKVDGLKKDVHSLILSKELLARVRREDRIAALQEAVSISEVLNDKDRQVKSRITLNTEELPLYMLTPDVLRAEIKVLGNRKNDAPFIEGLRDLEEGAAALAKIKIDAQAVKPVFIDQQAFVPKYPVKPSKVLILVLFSLFGMMLGVVITFIRCVTLENKRRCNE